MDGLIELAGIWLARAYALYGMALLLIPSVFFVNVALLAAVIWTAASHSRGRQPWPSVPAFMRRWVRLALEIGFGLINPVLYLAIFTPALSAFYSYRDVEPLPDEWTLPAAARTSVTSPIPVPAERHIVANALLDAQSNLAMCALILALYQNQWEATNRDWSLRGRPDILATLYQIGFARSKPHAAPQSNAFGSRVRQVYEQPWLGELLDTTPRPPG